MALEIVNDPGSGAYVEARVRLYQIDSGEFVDESYAGPERKRLYCGVGQRILRDDAKRDGLLDLVAEIQDEADDDESGASSDDESDPGAEEQPADGEADTAGGEAEVESEKPKPDAKTVRAWAKEQGFDVPARGKIPDEVYELYAEAQTEED